MIKKIVKRASMVLLIILGSYLIIGYLLHSIVFPEKRPEVSSYYKPGHVFYSKAEGFRQTVRKQEAGFVHGTLEVEPFAGGPPKHIHSDFDETFEIENGELTLWVDGKIVKLHPGEKLHIPKGTPHKPYNETGETIRVKGSFAFPEKFAFQLSQVYGFMDDNPDFANSPKTILQMALFQRNGFDSYIADGPPVAAQKLLGFLVAPLARAMGYRSYYEKYDTNRQISSR